MKNEATNKMKLNVQMFADTADNDSNEDVVTDSTLVNADNAGSEDKALFVDGKPSDSGNDEGNVQPTKNEEKKITTHAFSERLKREKLKIEQDTENKRISEMDKIAVARGFRDWKELDDFTQKESLTTMGIKDAGAFNSYLDDAISKNPIVVEAQRVLNSQKEKEHEAVLSEAITQISKIDSDIKSVNDLIALENYDEFYELVEKGYSLPDAYKIIAFDKIANKKAASAAQNVKTNIDSKGHIIPVAGTKTKEVSVPADIMASYKKNMPNMNEQQIKEHYGKFIGGNY